MLMYCKQNAEQNHDVAISKYFGTTLTSENFMQEKRKRRLNPGNACYYSVQNLLSSRLHSNININV